MDRTLAFDPQYADDPLYGVPPASVLAAVAPAPVTLPAAEHIQRIPDFILAEIEQREREARAVRRLRWAMRLIVAASFVSAAYAIWSIV